MRSIAVLTQNCTDSKVMEVNASAVDTIRLEGFAITVNKVTTEIKGKTSLTGGLVSVSLCYCVLLFDYCKP